VIFPLTAIAEKLHPAMVAGMDGVGREVLDTCMTGFVMARGHKVFESEGPSTPEIEQDLKLFSKELESLMQNIQRDAAELKRRLKA
jgi:hypothetical protein